ncbi:MAG: hypothetical protein V3W51_02690 [Candidatus Brocadiales bacterium]
MCKIVITLGLFLLLVSGGCVQGPEEEEGLDFRTQTMKWPNIYGTPGERQGPRPTLEQR